MVIISEDMMIYFSGGGSSSRYNPALRFNAYMPSFYRIGVSPVLSSTFNLSVMIERKMAMHKVKLFMDSGAYSAWAKGVKIDIGFYIDFLKEHEAFIDHYSVMDAIGDPEKTLENQKIMEKAGLHPLPCFHYGEPIQYLEKYVKEYEYISLGGMVPISTGDLRVWLDHVFGDVICDKRDGMPKVKVHGFGMTSLDLMVRYPWYSVDSTSWVLTGRFGSVFVPQIKNGQFVYDVSPWKVTVSNQSSKVGVANQHFYTFSEMEQRVILNYFKVKGFSMGKSVYRDEDRKTYKPDKSKGERWVNSIDADACRQLIDEFGTYIPPDFLVMKNIIEVIIEPGLSNDYRQRDELNILYFLDLERNLPKWPWPFKSKIQKGFGMKQEIKG